MKRSDVILLLIIAFFSVWAFISVFYPFVGLMILGVALTIFVGVYLLIVIMLWRQRSS